MTEELKEIGLHIGHRRVGRLMRLNGISVVRTRKHKVTTDSDHKFNIAPNLLDRDFTADAPNQKWAGDISYVWTPKGCIHHTDRGSQYCSHDDQKILRQHGFKVSMSGKAIAMTMQP
jgi:putative transposase